MASRRPVAGIPLSYIPRMRRAIALAGALLAFAVPAALGAGPQWTTYHRDAARSGVDPESTEALKPSRLWQTPQLDGAIWGEPLVYGPYVYVATENDTIYAIDAENGSIAWENHVGTPVPSGELPCGDIDPVVGITSTPVIDSATNTIYAVEETWDGTNQSSIRHELVALDTQTGAARAGFPVGADPTYPAGGSARYQLQRAALALDGSEIVIGYGGNDGDCNEYWGWLVAASKSGMGANFQFQVDGEAGHHGGAIWGAGNGPAVDSAGRIYTATGNGYSGEVFDYSESVLELEPDLKLIEFWAPEEWRQLDEGDGDLGSSGPILLPDELVFEIGKSGEGVLLRRGLFGGIGGKPVASVQVCGSWGGGIYVPAGPEGGTLYVSCLSGGLHAVAVSELGSRPIMALAAAWEPPEAAIGPPIYAGGLVWATHWSETLQEGGGVLYGIDPVSGQVAFEEDEGAFTHFATPSAGAGRLFVANGTYVTALRIATSPSESSPAGAGGQSGAPAGSTPPGAGPSPSSGSASLAIAILVRRHLRHRAGGRRVMVTLRCQSRTLPCAGIVRLLLVRHRGAHRRRAFLVRLAAARFGPRRGTFTVTLHLSARARSVLARRRSRGSALEIEIGGEARNRRYLVAW